MYLYISFLLNIVNFSDTLMEIAAIHEQLQYIQMKTVKWTFHVKYTFLKLIEVNMDFFQRCPHRKPCIIIPPSQRPALLQSFTEVGGARKATEQQCQEVYGVGTVVYASSFSKRTQIDKQWCRRRSVSRTRKQPWTVSGSGLSCSACLPTLDTGAEIVQ